VTVQAVLVWSPSDVADADTVARFDGKMGRHPGVAYFAGAAEALRAAVGWQQLEPTEPRRSIVVVVAEVRPADPDGSSAVAAAAKIAETVAAGAIVGTEVVRLLVPEPDCGTWAEPAPLPGATTEPWHELDWRRAAAPLGVVVAEDAAIIRAGIVSLLRADGMEILAEADDYESLVSAVRRTRPRLLITDIRMPPGQRDEGLRAAHLLRAEQTGLAVLVLSQHVQASAATQLLSGRMSGIGYLLKERVTALDDFLSAARTVADGGTVIDPLITREMLGRRRTDEQLQA
jgi:DNA-binding NarL/FixJ family response regulator